MKSREECLEILRQHAIAHSLIDDSDEFTEDTNLDSLLDDFEGDFDDISYDVESELELELDEGREDDPATPGEWLDWIMPLILKDHIKGIMCRVWDVNSAALTDDDRLLTGEGEGDDLDVCPKGLAKAGVACRTELGFEINEAAANALRQVTTVGEFIAWVVALAPNKE